MNLDVALPVVYSLQSRLAYLSGWLVVRPYHQLHTVGLQSVKLKELNDVELCRIKGQALHFYNAIHVHM